MSNLIRDFQCFQMKLGSFSVTNIKFSSIITAHIFFVWIYCDQRLIRLQYCILKFPIFGPFLPEADEPVGLTIFLLLVQN